MMTPAEREAWLKEREAYLTASDVAAVMGLNPHKNAKRVWKEKVERLHADIDHLPVVAAGRHLEAGIVAWHAEDRGLTARTGFPLTPHPTCTALAATPDAVCTDNQGREWVTEVKNVRHDKHEVDWAQSWACDDLDNRPLQFFPRCADRSIRVDTLTAPRYYLVQLQAQMACLGIPRGRIVVCFGGQNRVDLDYEMAPRFVERMLSAVTDFWATVLVARELKGL